MDVIYTMHRLVTMLQTERRTTRPFTVITFKTLPGDDKCSYFITCKVSGSLETVYFNSQSKQIYLFYNKAPDGKSITFDQNTATLITEKTISIRGSMDTLYFEGIGEFLYCINTPVPQLITGTGDNFMLKSSLPEDIIAEFNNPAHRQWTFKL